uniref:Dynein heavy chain 12, axonemal n=1 Tax=Sphenodon punctatus TaxID=8508 RepID=A0A8D0GGB1_SPHPU
MSLPNRSPEPPNDEAWNIRLPPIVLPTTSAAGASEFQKKLLKYRRFKEQQKMLNEIVTAMEEDSKRDPKSPVPELPSTVTLPMMLLSFQTNYLFMKKCVESNPVVPIQQEWLTSMLTLVPQHLMEGKDRELLVEQLLAEVTREFEMSMKRYMGKCCKGLDFSRPWHNSFVQARNQIISNLHILHPTLKVLLDVGYTAFSKLLVVDLSSIRAKGPTDCESLKNDVSITCVKTEEKLLNTWFPKVINLFTRKEALQGVKSDKLDSFYNCVATLMSNQLKELLRRTVEAYVKLFDLEDQRWLPLFKMELTFDDEKMEFYPSFEDLEEAILFIVTQISQTLQNVQAIHSWLAAGATVTTVDTELPDHVIAWAQSTLKRAVKENLKGPREHFENYVDSYGWLVDGTAAERIKQFEAEEHSFDEYADFIDEFLSLAKEIMSLPLLANFPMVRLDCDDLKQGLADKAKSIANMLLERIVADHRDENEMICKEFEMIKEHALKVPETTEEMMEMIEYVEKAKTTGIQQLLVRIKECHRRLNYLLDVFLFAPEDLSLNATVLLWPQKINPIFDENDELIERSKLKGENELLAKREKLMLEIEKQTRRMEELTEYSELDRMQQYVTDMRTLQKRIHETDESVAFINKEENLLKWELTEYPDLENLKVNIEPYQKLFVLILKWQRTEKRWMDGAFLDLNGESMETEVDEFFRESYKMFKFFQQKQKKAELEKKKMMRRTIIDDKVEEEKKENPTITMCGTVMQQVKDFKVKEHLE